MTVVPAPVTVVAVRIDQPDDDDAPTPARDLPAKANKPADVAGLNVPDKVAVPDAGDRNAQGGTEVPRVEAAAEASDPEAARQTRIARTEEYKAKVDAAERAYAIDQAYDKITEIERGTVTPALQRIESQDPTRHLAGLDHRLKGKDRLTEKVTQIVDERGRSVDEALGLIKDAIRYTFVYAEDRYTQGVDADCDRLSAGFALVDRKNLWDGLEYKGINGRWRVPDTDQLFEVQFHTEASLDAKEETHGAYERLRTLPEDDTEVSQLHAYQREVTAKIPIPPGALDIPNRP